MLKVPVVSDVYTVSNVEDSGKRSLREGILSAKGPRTIVFAVSGLINLNPKKAADRNGYDLFVDYTNLEVYFDGTVSESP